MAHEFALYRVRVEERQKRDALQRENDALQLQIERAGREQAVSTLKLEHQKAVHALKLEHQKAVHALKLEHREAVSALKDTVNALNHQLRDLTFSNGQVAHALKLELERAAHERENQERDIRDLKAQLEVRLAGTVVPILPVQCRAVVPRR